LAANESVVDVSGRHASVNDTTIQPLLEQGEEPQNDTMIKVEQNEVTELEGQSTDQDTPQIQWLPLTNVKTTSDGSFDVTASPAAQIQLPARFKPGTSLSLAVRINGTTFTHHTTLQLVGRHGFSVISDVDDTVKDSRVLQKRVSLKRALMEPYTPVPGMPELFGALYKSLALPDRVVVTKHGKRSSQAKTESDTGLWSWARDFFTRINPFKKDDESKHAATVSPVPMTDVQFHFLSASPYDLLPSLTEFIRHYFPVTSSLLPSPHRIENIRDQYGLDLRSYKFNGTRWIANQFPERVFLLIGDSGQFDPEAYGDVMRAEQSELIKLNATAPASRGNAATPTDWLPKRQFKCLLIRLVQGQNPTVERQKNSVMRFRDSFQGLHPTTWRVFGHAHELLDVPFHTGACYAEHEHNIWQERIEQWEAKQEQLRKEAAERQRQQELARQRMDKARQAWKRAKHEARQASRRAERSH